MVCTGAPAAGGAHPHPVVLDHEVGALDQRHAHLARQEHMLEIGRVVDAGRQQHDLRVGHALRRDLAHRLQQPAAVIVDRAQPHPGHQVGEGARHQVAVLDHVGHAGRRAGIVLQHQEAARRRRARCRCRRYARRCRSGPGSPPSPGGNWRCRTPGRPGMTPSFTMLPVVVDVVQERVQRRDALLHARLSSTPPFGRRSGCAGCSRTAGCGRSRLPRNRP